MASLDDLKNTFFEECAEGLDAVDRGLNELSSGQSGDASETVNAVFRAIHSIKGGAGVFGFDGLVGFAHAFETVLDALRHGKLEPSSDVVAVLLKANDTLSDLVDMAKTGDTVPEGFDGEVRSELESLSKSEDDAGDIAEDFAGIEFKPVLAEETAETVGDVAAQTFNLSFHPRSARYDDDFLVLVRLLRDFGSVRFSPDESQIPTLAAFDAQQPYINWSGTIETSAPFETLRAAIASIDLAADWTLEPSPSSEVSPPPPAIELLPQEDPQLAEPEQPKLPAENAAEKGTKAPSTTTIRVDLDKIDRVVNMVGELVISQTMLHQLFQNMAQDADLRMTQVMEDVVLHTRELKNSVMSMRAQPIRSVFQRMSRVVREVAAKTGKKIELETVGEATEVDKTVVERLSDPLTHIIRNAADHGIETPEKRRAAGKSEEGKIRLLADQRGSRIVIEVSDDGGGLDQQRILKKARDKGLVAADAKLTEDEINNLIFLPGFSTAETISDVSGRGVGMDVVRRNIQDLGGRVSVKSKAGSGMTIQLTLPLTLAVTDGMIVKVGDETYVVPITCIVECLRPARKDIKDLMGAFGTLQVRGVIVPVISLAEMFGIDSSTEREDETTVLLIENSQGVRSGIVVDQLCGHQQVVIKSIEENYDAVAGIAGATILGDGQVAFILDAERIGDLVQSPDVVPAAALQNHVMR